MPLYPLISRALLFHALESPLYPLCAKLRRNTVGYAVTVSMAAGLVALFSEQFPGARKVEVLGWSRRCPLRTRCDIPRSENMHMPDQRALEIEVASLNLALFQ